VWYAYGLRCDILSFFIHMGVQCLITSQFICSTTLQFASHLVFFQQYCLLQIQWGLVRKPVTKLMEYCRVCNGPLYRRFIETGI